MRPHTSSTTASLAQKMSVEGYLAAAKAEILPPRYLVLYKS